MPANFNETAEGGRSVLAGRVDLYFRTSSRILVLRVPGEPDRLFILRLAANPRAERRSGPGRGSITSPTGRTAVSAREETVTLTRSDTGSSAPIDCQNAW
jgi:hypothetical protein